MTGVERRRWPQFLFENSAQSMAGPILAHASIVEHAVPIMMIWRKSAKKISMLLRGQSSWF